MFIHLYLMSCNYFWMLCEGIYLHTLIVVAVFAEKQHLMWYYLLGWGESGWMGMLSSASHTDGLNVFLFVGFPLVPAVIHSLARYFYYNDR